MKSRVPWAEDHAVAEVFGLSPFDEDDLYAALDDRCARQEKIERRLKSARIIDWLDSP